ncbi:MAG TPA: glycosyltransferase [Candidatus Saccharimonadales bacterium]|nr:glycosyltransferase [Candidatus Saccharimonadales bacterium]
MEGDLMIVIVTHAVFLHGKDIYGPPHAVSLFLNKKKITHIFIKHNLYGTGPSVVEYYKNGKKTKTENIKNIAGLVFLQYFYEFLITSWIVVSKAKRCQLFIGVDPLNEFAGNVLKTIGIVGKTIYFSADFALLRFPNSMLNNFYLWLDKKAMLDSNQTWSVSKRIQLYRKENGLDNGRNLLLPNAPFFDEVKRFPYGKIQKHSLVLVSALEKGIAFELLFDVVAKLKQKLPDVTLVLIGTGSLEGTLKEYVKEKKLENTIQFVGVLSHNDMFKLITRCAIGIAFYENSDKTHFRYFSDPMKVRDYLASGLPAFISGNSGIGDELEKKNAGVKVDLSEKDIYEKLLMVLDNPGKYQKMREHAIALANEYNMSELLSNYLKQLDVYE